MKKINILFCLHYSGINNGAVRSLVDVIENLNKENKFNIFVIYPDKHGSAITRLNNIGIETKYIPFYRIDVSANKSERTIKKRIKYCMLKAISPISFYRAKRFAIKNDINIVYSNTIVIDYGFKLSRILNVPHVWHVREFGREDHNIVIRGGDTYLYDCMSKSTLLIYISKSIEKKYNKYVLSRVKSQVIYNDISPEFINPKRDFIRLLNEPILHAAIIGTIQEGKRQLDAIRAVEIVNQNVKKIELHICGEMRGPYYEMIKNYVRQHHLEDMVVFDGFHSDMNSYRSSMDIAIISSSHEAFGRVTIEGMLSELVVIGARSDGTEELIDDNVTGLLYQPDEIRSLSEQLNWVTNHRKESAKIAKAGFLYAKDKFTSGRAACEISKILTETV